MCINPCKFPKRPNYKQTKKFILLINFIAMKKFQSCHGIYRLRNLILDLNLELL